MDSRSLNQNYAETTTANEEKPIFHTQQPKFKYFGEKISTTKKKIQTASALELPDWAKKNSDYFISKQELF